MRGVAAKASKNKTVRQEQDGQDTEGEAPATGILVAPISGTGPLADAADDRRSTGASDALEAPVIVLVGRQGLEPWTPLIKSDRR
jgi:hypothetical protein